MVGRRFRRVARRHSQRRSRRGAFCVGVITSLSGVWAKGGAATKRGYDLWAALVNHRGGIQVGRNRYAIKLSYYDDKSDPCAATRAARDLLSSDVDFILGPYSSSTTLAIAPLLEEAGIPQVTGSAEAAEIYRQGFEWTFGTLASNVSAVRSLTELVRQLVDALSSAAVIGADDVFSRTTAELFCKAIEKLHLKIKLYEIYPVALTDFRPLIQKVKVQIPDLFMVSGHVDNLIKATQATKAVALHPKVYVMHYGVASHDFIEALRHDAKHILGISQWNPQAPYYDSVFGNSQDFLKLFTTWYHRIPDHTEVGCATAGSVFQQVVEEAGLTPPLDQTARMELRHRLQHSRFKTLFGSITLSQSGYIT